MRFGELSTSKFVRDVRIAFLTPSLGPHSLPLCERLAKICENFRVFTSAEADEFHGFPREWGSVNVTVQKSFNRFRVLRKAYGYWQTGELHIPYDTYYHLKKFSPDLIISNQLGVRTALAVLYRKHNKDVKLILWATLSHHSERKRTWLRRLLRKWIISNIDAAFVHGKSGEEYLRVLGYRGPVYGVPYTIDGEIFENREYRPEAKLRRLLYAGMLIPQKGVVPFTAGLVKWCANHPETRVRFQLIGDGPERGKLTALKLPTNLELEILPKMSRTELAKHYEKCDIFAFPTLGDEWGIVVNESMISGRPVLGSIYSQAATELIVEGETGWLFDPNNTRGLYESLDRALTRSVAELEVMSAKARLAVEHLSPNRIAERVLSAVSSLCAGTGKTDSRMSFRGNDRLRVLVVHNRYREAGGEDQVVAREVDMLASRGHLVEYLSFNNDAIQGKKRLVSVALNSFYSSLSRKLVEEKIAAFRPDLVHVHNFVATLSPSVFFAANSMGVPVVHTLHNYRLICSNAKLFRDGAPCEECLQGGSFLPAIEHACYRDSRTGSAVMGASIAVHGMLGTWSERVDRYIVLSEFTAAKMTQLGLSKEKVSIKPNFSLDNGVGKGEGGFALFVGRLVPEKGIETLIAADKLNRLPCPLYIVGTGPMAKTLEEASAREGSKLVVLGQKNSAQVVELMKQATVLLFPSLWYEPFGLVIIEAMACGLPVIGSRIGAVPEIVEDGVSGLLYQVGSADGLCGAVEQLWSNKQRLKEMRVAARRRYEEKYTEEANYKQLINIYEEVLQSP